MSENEFNEATSPSPRISRLKRWVILAAAILVLPAVAVAALWFGPRPRVAREHVSLVRGPDGSLVPESPPETSGVQFEAHAGKLEAKDDMSSSCVSSSGERARLACRRWMVLNRSEHLMMRRMSDALVEDLRKLSYVERIDYYPPGVELEEGGLAPDMVVVLDLKSWKESGLLWQSNVKTEIIVTAGNRLACSNSSYQDSLTPPVVNLHWQGCLHHASTTKGLASSAAKYKQIAEHCAKQISQALCKQLNTEIEKHGMFDGLPEAFYPAYNCPRQLPFWPLYAHQRLAAWHGLMSHCDATWRLTTNQEPDQVLGNIRRLMEHAGWKCTDQSKPPQAHMRMVHGTTVLEIFPEKENGALPGVEIQTANQVSADRTFYVHYRERMGEKELADAVDRAVGDNVPLDTLTMFQNSWTPEQCRKILGRMETRRPTDPDGWLTLAGIYQRLKETAKARDAVLKARTFEPTVPDTSRVSGKIESMAKSLGDPSLAKRPIDVALLKEAGFIEIKPGAALPNPEVDASQAACFFVVPSDGKPRTIAVRRKITVPNGPSEGQLTIVVWSEGSKSWSTGGASHATHIDGVGTVQITSTPHTERHRFRVSARISPLAAKTTAKP